MSKHTPGPWEAHETGEGLPWPAGVLTAVYKAGSERLKTDCICDLIAQGDGKYDPDVTNANARLIAAAPDLLEAAQHIAGWFRSMLEYIPDYEWEQIEPVVAAIAKAKGD
jgi:hypothetical protein